jgi:predicted nucleic acid-binding Zn finger protein
MAQPQDPSQLRLRLIGGTQARSTGMNTNPVRPLFPVPANAPVRTLEENVKAVGTCAHVCEVAPAVSSGATYALVHASPSGVAKIAELGLEVFHSRKGDDYYAVLVGKAAQAPVPSVPATRPTLVSTPAAPSGTRLLVHGHEVVLDGFDGRGQSRDDEGAPPARSAPAARHTVDPVAQPSGDGSLRLDIRGTTYVVRQTTTKRRIDVLRYEVRKDAGDVITEPYVVSFQDEAGRSGGCSCPDWIYRRGQKGDCKHIQSVRNALVRPRQAGVPLRHAN